MVIKTDNGKGTIQGTNQDQGRSNADPDLDGFSFPTGIDRKELLSEGFRPQANNTLTADESLTLALTTGKGLDATKLYLSPSAEVNALVAKFERSGGIDRLPEDISRLIKSENNA